MANVQVGVRIAVERVPESTATACGPRPVRMASPRGGLWGRRQTPCGRRSTRQRCESRAAVRLMIFPVFDPRRAVAQRHGIEERHFVPWRPGSLVRRCGARIRHELGIELGRDLPDEQRLWVAVGHVHVQRKWPRRLSGTPRRAGQRSSIRSCGARRRLGYAARVHVGGVRGHGIGRGADDVTTRRHRAAVCVIRQHVDLSAALERHRKTLRVLDGILPVPPSAHGPRESPRLGMAATSVWSGGQARGEVAEPRNTGPVVHEQACRRLRLVGRDQGRPRRWPL